LNAEASPKTRRITAPLLRLVRRVHLYLGLLLWPFALFFGLTGLSFNHPTVGRGLEVRRFAPETVARRTGFHRWDPRQIAERIVEDLNWRGRKYRLDTSERPRFSGFPLFLAPVANGKQVLILSLSEGHATLTERPDPPHVERVPFEGERVVLPEYGVAKLADRLNPLLREPDSGAQGPFRAHPEIHPELRFSLAGPDGVAWNVVYDLSTGELSGTPRDSVLRGSVTELLESLHKQHHYPPHADATSAWALFADLTALTLILWAVSGLVMWWQLKRLRFRGAVVVVLAIASSAAVISATAREIRFGSTAEGR
jgi:hypothetical protein